MRVVQMCLGAIALHTMEIRKYYVTGYSRNQSDIWQEDRRQKYLKVCLEYTTNLEVFIDTHNSHVYCRCGNRLTEILHSFSKVGMDLNADILMSNGSLFHDIPTL